MSKKNKNRTARPEQLQQLPEATAEATRPLDEQQPQAEEQLEQADDSAPEAEPGAEVQSPNQPALDSILDPDAWVLPETEPKPAKAGDVESALRYMNKRRSSDCHRGSK